MNTNTLSYTDLNTIAELAANICGVPIRVYNGSEKVSVHSFLNLLADPFDTCVDELEGKDEGIDWIFGDNYYYGVTSRKDLHLVIGPVAESLVGGDNALNLAKKLNMKDEDAIVFVHQMRSIRQLSAYFLCYMMSLLNFLVSGNYVLPQDVKLWSIEPSDLGYIEDPKEAILQYQTFAPDQQMSQLPAEKISEGFVKSGMPLQLRSFIDTSNIFSFHANFQDSSLDNARGTFNYMANRMLQVISDKGIDYNKADALRKSYINRCAALTTVEDIDRLKKELLMTYAEKSSNGSESFKYSKMVIDAMDFINRNLTNFIDTSDVAEYLFVSRSRLSTVFKQDTGIFLSDYIHMQKLELGKMLLSSSNMSIADIAAHLAYKSQSHFTSVFKRFENITPSEYRKRNWSEESKTTL